MAEFNVGYNGSENFAPGKRYGTFPAMLLGWVVSDEAVLQAAYQGSKLPEASCQLRSGR